MGILEGEERVKGTNKIFETVRTENFPRINIRHQTTDLGSSESSKQDKCQNKNKQKNQTKPSHIIFNYRKSKIKEKSRGKEYLTYGRTKIRITSAFSENIQAKRTEWSIWSVARKCPTNLEFCTCKIILQKWRWNKDFDRQTKLRESVASSPALQEMLKEVI